MIVRTHETQHFASEAVYSDCNAYRYRLTRRWGPGRLLNYVMLNPSVADERHNDPTVERCERRARLLGFEAFSVTNIFAWRDTDPHQMKRAVSPNGPQNDDILIAAARAADQVIAAWGTHGAHKERGPEVARMLASHGVVQYHLGVTKDGHPRHLLYVRYSQRPILWKNR